MNIERPEIGGRNNPHAKGRREAIDEILDFKDKNKKLKKIHIEALTSDIGADCESSALKSLDLYARPFLSDLSNSVNIIYI